MISNEQMDTLIGRLKVYGSESGRGKDHPNAIACRTAASVIIEQQAEIERLREIIAIMDSVTPKADDTCDEPGIVLSVAVQRRYPHLSKGATQ